jgi:hypothetical protein
MHSVQSPTGKGFPASQGGTVRDKLLMARRALLGDMAVVKDALRTIDEERESELEERSQEESAGVQCATARERGEAGRARMPQGERMAADEIIDTVLAGGELSEDIFEVVAEGLDYMPPTRPVAEEE